MAKRAAGKRRTSGLFVMVLHSMMKSPAWHDLSGNAVKLLLHLIMLSQGNNGWGHKDEPGELFLGEREAAEAVGVARNTVSRAFEELIEHGFLRVVRAGHFHVKVRVATAWRLTFQPYPRNHQAPTNEWRDWRPSEKRRAQKLKPTGLRIEQNSNKRRLSGSKDDPVICESARNARIEIGSKTDPHLYIPWGGGCGGVAWWGADARMQAQQLSVQVALATLDRLRMPLA